MYKTHNNADTHKYRKIIMGLYLLTIVVIIVMVMTNIFYKTKRRANYGLDDFTMITEGWKDKDGNDFEFSDIDKYVHTKYESLDVYYKLPYNLLTDESIVMRSQNAYVMLLIDNKVIYETDIAYGPYYNHSPGTRWNVISIPREYTGKVINLKIKKAYNDDRCKVSNIYLGDKGAILINIIKDKATGLALSFIMLTIGLIYLLVNIAINRYKEVKDYSLNYLGVFAVLCSLWCILETNILQLFCNNLRLLQTIDDTLLVIGSMPLLFYLDSVYNIFRYRAMKIFCAVDLFYIISSTFCQLKGFYDYHQTLFGARILYGCISVILIVCIVTRLNNIKRKGNSIGFSIKMQAAGIVILGISVLTDIFRYITSDVMDRASVIRIGLLIMIVIFGAENIHEMARLIKQGMKTEIISKLAYTDGLTDVNNRTAYKEDVEKLKKYPPYRPMGIVMFDINNLKMTNDNIGHHEGDELIKISSQLIVNAFGSNAKVYRIGGDEFVCLITGHDPEGVYVRAISDLFKSIDEENKENIYPFEISIAHGASFCDVTSDYDIRLAQEVADKEMYKNKYEMKHKKAECV